MVVAPPAPAFGRGSHREKDVMEKVKIICLNCRREAKSTKKGHRPFKVYLVNEPCQCGGKWSIETDESTHNPLNTDALKSRNGGTNTFLIHKAKDI